jgi:thymidylate synthase
MGWELEGYAPLIRKIIRDGEKRSTRAGDAYSLFGETLTVDLAAGFPLLTGRRMFPRPILGELAAMLQGPKNVADFKKHGCNYWDAWGAKQGDCLYDGSEAQGGELNLDYGNAWIDFNGVNQLEKLVNTLKTNPTDRRMLITGWRPDKLDELSLPCCHLLYQWYVREGTYLDMAWYQRSVDTMVGLPSDIVLAAAWTIILANQCGFKPGKVTMMLGDTHIYANHTTGVVDYLARLEAYPFVEQPDYFIDEEATVESFEPDDILITNYDAGPVIKFELNV